MTGGYPELQADSLAEVVEFGLRWLYERHGRPMIIDDSGLFVDALGGWPGVFSADAYKKVGCDGLLKLMGGLRHRTARFECVAGYIDADGIRTAVGTCEGMITEEKRGEGGFGYDPIFVPTGHDQTFAEMDMEDKNLISHRGKAFSKLAGIINGEQ